MLGTQRHRQRQRPLWIPASELPNAGHPFYTRLNQILDEEGFDVFAEGKCQRFYDKTMGRPGLPPGIYFRLLLIGYFEGLDAERAIAWRAADSLAIRQFLRIDLDEDVPDHSTISRTRRLIDLETHGEIFGWVLQLLARKGLLKGKTIGIDATTLEANAALRSIVRRDTGESYEEFLRRLAKAAGIETPTREQMAKLDRKRPKKGSNQEWMHPHDPEARITKMKDGRTHLAHKAEHAVDVETGAVVAVTVQPADEGDTTTMVETIVAAAEQMEKVAENPQAAEQVNAQGWEEVVADKGYHSNQAMVDLREVGLRSYVSEPDRGERRWSGKTAEQSAVYANRRRIKGKRGRALRRRRGEVLERSFAHLYETGGMRRTYLKGQDNIRKRLLIHASGLNLGLVMRVQMGVGTPRGMQGRPFFVFVWILCWPNGWGIHARCEAQHKFSLDITEN